MRYSTALIAATSTLAPAVAAIGNAVVLNKCSATIYVYSVGSTVSDQQALTTGQNYTEAFHRDPITGGIALKITKVSNGLNQGAPQQIFSYSLDGATVWYDLSTVLGEPFEGNKVTVTQEGSPSIEWAKGSNPGGSQVKSGVSDKDVVFTACA